MISRESRAQSVNAARAPEHSLTLSFLLYTGAGRLSGVDRKVSVWRNWDSETQIPDRRSEEVPQASQSPGTGGRHLLHFDGGMHT